MNTIISHSGEVIELPYIGCYSGCASDYCFLFGHEVPVTLVRLFWLFVFGIGLILLTFLIRLIIREFKQWIRTYKNKGFIFQKEENNERSDWKK
jgi:hypothetical protein